MNSLRRELLRYIGLRQAVGFKLRGEKQKLSKFLGFLEQRRAGTVTTSLAIEWAMDSRLNVCTRMHRLSSVRGFAQFLCVRNPRTEVPPVRLIRLRYVRPKPYYYSERDVARLVMESTRRQARRISVPTYGTVIGLLAVTGMRLGEAVALEERDVDLANGVLRLRETKFRKTRCIPLSKSTVAALRRYSRSRDLLIARRSTAFFVTEQGCRICREKVEFEFARVSCKLGLRAPGRKHGHGPRLHDLRHTFAIRTLVNWYKMGLDVERELPRLSDFLGHKNLSSTYWYLSATPELLRLAAGKLHPLNGGMP